MARARADSGTRVGTDRSDVQSARDVRGGRTKRRIGKRPVKLSTHKRALDQRAGPAGEIRGGRGTPQRRPGSAAKYRLGMPSTTDVRRRLLDVGYELPTSLPAPAGRYEPYRLLNGYGTLSAQVPGYGPEAPTGRVGAELSEQQGCEAARMAAVNALGRLHEALGDFERLLGLLHLAGHVASADGFLDQPRVVDGASELLVAALGDFGRHSRTAFGPARLPRDVPVELEITFAYRN